MGIKCKGTNDHPLLGWNENKIYPKHFIQGNVGSNLYSVCRVYRYTYLTQGRWFSAELALWEVGSQVGGANIRLHLSHLTFLSSLVKIVNQLVGQIKSLWKSMNTWRRSGGVRLIASGCSQTSSWLRLESDDQISIFFILVIWLSLQLIHLPSLFFYYCRRAGAQGVPSFSWSLSCNVMQAPADPAINLVFNIGRLSKMSQITTVSYFSHLFVYQFKSKSIKEKIYHKPFVNFCLF
jgi:hypothetical protein